MTSTLRFLLTCALLFSGSMLAMEKPNIILIMADDLGFETMTVNGGDSYQTPNLDRLAENGAQFLHCYANPICTPSRVKIMTGRYGVKNYEEFGKLPRQETTFAHRLKDLGYATCIAGKWQLGKQADSPQHFGFDQALLWQHTRNGRKVIDGQRIDKRYQNPILEKNGEELDYHDGEYAPDLMVDFLCDFITEHKDQPILAYYPMILTHCPFGPTPHSDSWDPKDPGSVTYKGKKQYFGSMVEYVDHLVGRIEKHLEKLGLLENSYIIFTGDNGTDPPVVSQFKGQPYPGQKGKMTNAGTHVPLIISRPGVVKPQVTDQLVDFTDFTPTLLEMAGRPVINDDSLDGHSFLPQLLGKENPECREIAYVWYNRNMKEGQTKVFARTQRYKLYASGKFFDIQNDLWETSPISALSSEQVEIKTKLQQRIDHLQKFEDPSKMMPKQAGSDA